MILLYIERYARFQHGISKNNEYFAEVIKKRWTNVHIVEEISSQTNKFKMVLNFIYFLFFILRNKPNIIYYVPSETLRSRITLFCIVHTINLLKINSRLILHFHRSDIQNFDKTGISIIKIKNIKTSLIFISDIIKNDFNRKFNQYNFYDTFLIQNFAYKLPKKNKRIEHYGSSIKISFVSNICEEKGFKRYLQICESLIKEYQLDIELSIHGKCINGYNSLQLKKDLSTRFKRFQIMGSYTESELPSIFSNADLVLFPSKNEGDPLIIHELVAHNVPFFCSDVGFVREFLGADFEYFITSNGLFHNKYAAKKIAKWLMEPKLNIGYSSQDILVKRYTNHHKQLKYFFKKNKGF